MAALAEQVANQAAQREGETRRRHEEAMTQLALAREKQAGLLVVAPCHMRIIILTVLFISGCGILHSLRSEGVHGMAWGTRSCMLHSWRVRVLLPKWLLVGMACGCAGAVCCRCLPVLGSHSCERKAGNFVYDQG